MPTQRKQNAVETLTNILSEAESVVVTNYRGLQTTQLQELRKALSKHGAKYEIVKNTLLKLAWKGNENLKTLAKNVSGPTAILVCTQKTIESLKELVRFAKENNQLEIRQAFFENQIFGAEAITNLAKIPNREGLLGKLVGTLNNPRVRLVRTLSNPYTSLVMVLNNISTQKEG